MPKFKVDDVSISFPINGEERHFYMDSGKPLTKEAIATALNAIAPGCVEGMEAAKPQSSEADRLTKSKSASPRWSSRPSMGTCRLPRLHVRQVIPLQRLHPERTPKVPMPAI